MSVKKQSFVSSAMIFAAAGIVIKILGAVYKIILGQKSFLGTQGSAWISFVYPYYNFFLILAIAGIPAAVAKIISEHHSRGEIQEKETVFRVMRIFMIFLGIVLAILFYIISTIVTVKFDRAPALLSMRAMNLAVLIVPIMASYRGYFQGHGNLNPFAGSQIVEQLGKVIFGLLFAKLFFSKGLEYATAGAMLGVAVGAALGVLLLMFCAKSYRNNFSLPKGEKLNYQDTMRIIKRILYYAVPITIGASVVPLTELIDGILIKSRLMDIGFSGELAETFYSYHAFYTISVINLPVILFVSVQVSVLPAVSSLLAVGEDEELGKTIRTALKVILILSLASAAGLIVLAKPVLMLLWPSLTDMHNEAKVLLQIMAVAMVFVSMYQCTSGILQGMGLHIRNAFNLLMGAVLKAIFSYFLLAIPSIGIKGASLSSLFAFSVAAILNLITLKRRTTVKFDFFGVFIKPFLAALFMGISVYLVYGSIIKFLPNSISTLFSVFVGAAVYLVLIIKLKILNKDDLAFIPGKRFLVRFIK